MEASQTGKERSTRHVLSRPNRANGSDLMKKIAILISGRGTNMQAIVDARLPHEICGVISNNPNAAGLHFAKSRNINTCVVNHRDYPDRESFDEALGNAIAALQPDLVVLAGFMRILTVGLTTRFAGKMINIHPSLLPAFRGLDTHERAIGGGVKLHGCTVHFVTPNLDEGPIIAQAALCVRPNDTPQTLAERVLVLEHEILPKTVAWVLDGHCTMESNRVTLDPSIIDDSFSFQR